MIRLFVNHALTGHTIIPLESAQAHYLLSVMRLRAGDTLYVFNGLHGEWQAQIASTRKRHETVQILAQRRCQSAPADVWLVFAPLKQTRTEFIIEKATEMGCRKICPIVTQRTNTRRQLNTQRLYARAIEAAEQCGLLSLPEILPSQCLQSLLDCWPDSRKLLFADETLTAPTPLCADSAKPDAPWAVLIGPEGGFTPEEGQRLRSMDSVVPISLGPRILRADTAAVAALAIGQSILGEWKDYGQG